MKHPRLVFIACVLAVAGGAVALRLPRLGLRPMHGDEANQGVKAGDLLETGVYRYDPGDHHGPTLYYLTLPSAWLHSVRTLAAMTEPMLRIVPALFGVGVVLLFLLAGQGLGRPAAVCGAILTAISPAMVYYSRYYIQEMLLVFFTFGVIVAGWQYVRSRSIGWILVAGACFGLMHATKETWVVAAAAMAAALAATWLWARWVDRQPMALRPWLNGKHLAAAVALAIVVAATLFSSFLTHARGPLDSILAYAQYFNRAGGAGLHDKPWYYYLGAVTFSRFVTGVHSGPWWSEGLILGLAAIGIVAALAKRGIAGAHVGLLRFLVFYTLAVTAAYAIIPYKTPWCALTFLHGFILLAGVGAVALVRWVPRWPLKAIVCVMLAGLAAHLGWQAYRASYAFCADQRNPYFYAHPSGDVLQLAKRVEEAASVAPQGRDIVIKVITPENYWPLPWYLRGFEYVGYWHEVPDDPDAQVILTSPDVQQALDARLKGSYNKQSIFGLRPGVLMPVYVRQDLWELLVKKWSAPKAAGPQGGGP